MNASRAISALGLDPARLAPLRVLLWLIHAPSDFRHAAADAGGTRRLLASARRQQEVRFVARW